jgi:hypothetical protein
VSLFALFPQRQSVGNFCHRLATANLTSNPFDDSQGNSKMKTSQLIAIAALSLVAAVGAQAETYQGVTQLVSTKSRDEVNAEAVRTASAPNQNVVRGSRGPETVAVSKDRSIVEAEAVMAAHAPDQNVSAGSRVNSKVISTMANPADVRVEAQQGSGTTAK